MEMLTPELLMEALREIKFLREEYERQKPMTGGIHYNNLKQAKEYADSGDYERMSDFKDGHPDAEPEAYLESLDNRIRGIEEDQIEEDTYTVKLLHEQISPLVITLEDLRSDLGQDEFSAKGYLKVQEEISSLMNEAEELRYYIIEKWSSIKQKLLDEKKARTAIKLPWYKRIIGSQQ